MTIYRIHPDWMNYQSFSISTREVLEKLGEEYPFHIDRSPKSYSDVWKRLNIDFFNSNEYSCKQD